jgi:hypothetical protein
MKQRKHDNAQHIGRRNRAAIRDRIAKRELHLAMTVGV